MGSQSEWIIDKREAVGEKGMVSAMHPLAAEAGVEVLRDGGSAIDAAVAMAFAIGVVEPAMSGVGGIAFLVHRNASDGEINCIDGTSVLPRNIRPDEFDVLPGDQTAGMYRWPATRDDENNTGWKSPAVPGMPALMGEAHRRYGRLPWDRLLQPAIKLARDGVPVDYYLSLTITNGYENLARFPSSRELFFRPSGGPLAPPSLEGADWLVQPELAWTLEQIASDGPDTVYHGVVGERIVDQMEQHGGLITGEDLKSYRLLEQDPSRIDYRGYTIFGQIENSGVATVFQALKILEGFDLHERGFLSPQTVHIVLEGVRLAFRDRLRYLGDAELMPVPYHGVISSEYAALRRGEIELSRANLQAEAGDPWQFDAHSAPAESFRDGHAPGGRTTHINVIDRDGNLVSLTSTIGGIFGSGVVIPGTGIILNNATTWFDPRTGAVTSIGPGKRILSAATPMLVTRGNDPFAAMGAPGGRRIISAMTQVLLNLLEFGQGMQASISAPRTHTEGPVSEVSSGFSSEVVDFLEQAGHNVEIREDGVNAGAFARPTGIVIDPATGQRHGGAFQYTPATAIAE